MLKTAFIAGTLAIASLARADLERHGFAALGYIEQHFPVGEFYAETFDPEAGASGPSSAWSAGVMLSALNAAATIDPTRIPAARAYAESLDAYRWQKPGDVLGYQPFPVGDKAGDLYYDDNAWLVFTFLDTYKLTGDAAFLQRAKDAFAYLASGESDDLGGGIWWADFKKQKNTCSNAPAICAALALYEVTKDPALLAFAERIYTWVNRLQDADGLFFDNIDKDGVTIEKTKWSYNSALMIRANVMLYHVKKDDQFLHEANRIARAAELKWFNADGALSDEASFAHLLCEALLELHAVSPRPDTVARVTRSLEQLASIGRDHAYPKRWDGWRKTESRIELLHQASAARAFLFVGGDLVARPTP